MNPSSVFSLRRLAPAARIAAVVAAVLSLPAMQTVSAQDAGTAGTRDQKEFLPIQPTSTVYSTLFVAEGGVSTVFLGGNLGYEAILQPSGIPKGNFVQPTFGSAARIIFTAAPERIDLNGGTDRKILLGGLFGSAYAGFPAQNITRIALTGAVDTSFFVGYGANNFVTSILPLADGKIVVGGQFTKFNNETRLRIVRLNNNGSIDETFNATSLIDNDVLALAEGVQPNAVDITTDATTGVQTGTPRPDGTTLVAGTFNHVGGLSITKLARLNANGTVDATFRPVIDSRVLAIAVQPSGKIVIGGEFTSVNGVPAPHIARLNYDGSLDRTFGAAVTGLPRGESNPVAVYVLKQLKPTLNPDGTLSPGQIYLGGNFTRVNGLIRLYLGMINPNGTATAFTPYANIYDKVQSITVQPNNGRLLIGETLGPKIGKAFQPTIIRLYGATKSD